MSKFTADFETTVDENDCRVWAYALCEVGNTDNFIYGNSLDDFMKWCENGKQNHTLYFHNLKFDGEYIISWLFKHGFDFIKDKKDRSDYTFTTLITDVGQFYAIEIFFKVGNKRVNKVTIYDSLKILNFSVDQIAKDFNLPIRKLTLDYKAKREIGHELTPHEIDYIKNDVEIMARALEIMFNQDLTKMTIGGDALANYKEYCPYFKKLYPILDLEIDKDIRRSYKGGFTYLSPKYKEKTTGAGIVFDVNSLYPSVMYNRLLPYGQPMFFEGEYKYDRLYPLYVQRISCIFNLKKNKIPSIQIKNNMSFMPNEYVESSKGDIVTLTLTSIDLELFFENYNVEELTFDGGWKFKGMKGLFTDYIDYWTERKISAKKEGNSALYRIAKLMLNSLYGKFGLNPNSRLKYPVLEDGVVRYKLSDLEQRKPIYIPMATFITSYARAYTIRTSQAIREFSEKRYGVDKYVYSDTDSIHCLLSDEDVEELSQYMTIDDYELGAWKLESKFKKGRYLRQKCYIEEDYNDKINVTVAGLPKKLSPIITFDNFNIGFTTEGKEVDKKLTYKHVNGGVLLVDTDFTIK